MYRPYFCVMFIVLLTACAGFDGSRMADTPSDQSDESREKPAEDSGSPSFEQERQALFEQPYIDPLTKYLEQHDGDQERASVLGRIREERERRCDAIAAEYANESATRAALDRYRAGYSYSCPEQVSAFADRVSRESSRAETPDIVPIVTDTPSDDLDSAEQQALGDCYLLTSIRNYSAARQACLEPAQEGDTRSQANMALIAHAFEDYASALEWAEKAVPASSDACYLMGRMYASGHGVEQDMAKAVYWYSKAADQGHGDARAALDRHREQDKPVGDN